MRVRLAGVLILWAGSAVMARAQVPAGGEFQVSPSGVSADSPQVAAAPGGNFIVAWKGPDGGGGGGIDAGVFARRFDAAGLPQAASFRVNSDPAGSQVYGRVDADGLGRFVVAWTSYGGGPTGTFGTRIASGAAGPEFQIATATQLSTLTSAAAPSATACSSAAPPAPALGTT